MTTEGRPNTVRTAPYETTMKSLIPEATRSSAAQSGDRTVTIVNGALARCWETLAQCRRDLALIELRRGRGV